MVIGKELYQLLYCAKSGLRILWEKHFILKISFCLRSQEACDTVFLSDFIAVLPASTFSELSSA